MRVPFLPPVRSAGPCGWGQGASCHSADPRTQQSISYSQKLTLLFEIACGKRKKEFSKLGGLLHHGLKRSQGLRQYFYFTYLTSLPVQWFFFLLKHPTELWITPTERLWITTYTKQEKKKPQTLWAKINSKNDFWTLESALIHMYEIFSNDLKQNGFTVNVLPR